MGELHTMGAVMSEEIVKKILILGASRGLGLAIAESFAKKSNKLWLSSRKNIESSVLKSSEYNHIQCDFKDPIKSSIKIASIIQDQSLDIIIYNAGIWESDEFSKVNSSELVDIVNVNLTSLISAIHTLQKNLIDRVSHIFLIGSTCGLENEGASCVGYTAAKFGVRGAAQSLRSFFRKRGIRVTCINPGSIASDIPQGEVDRVERTYNGKRMPVDDLVSIIHTFSQLSYISCPKDLDIPATYDFDV